MKLDYHSILYVLVVLLAGACSDNLYENAVIVQDCHFTKVDTFYYSKNINMNVLSIDKIFKTDKPIIISSNEQNDIIKIYNKEFQFITSFADKGRVANELIMPQVCGVTDTTITILDNGKKEILVYDYSGTVLKSIKTDNKLYQQCKLFRSGEYLVEYKTHRSLSFHSTNDFSKVIFNFPIHAKLYENPQFYFGFLETSIPSQTIIYAHQYLRSIILLNYDGTIKKIIKREPQKDLIINENGNVDASNSITYYWGIQALEKSFIVYSINKSGRELAENYNQTMEFEEYDYDGKPLRKILIDRFISSFCIDGDKIYGNIVDMEDGFAVFMQKCL